MSNSKGTVKKKRKRKNGDVQSYIGTVIFKLKNNLHKENWY